MTRNYSFIGKDTTIHGAVTADEVIVEGMVEGEINASNRVLIKRGGMVDGPIQTRKILFEEGSFHKGSIKLDSDINGEVDKEVPIKESVPPEEQTPEPSNDHQSQSGKDSKEHQKEPQRLW